MIMVSILFQFLIISVVLCMSSGNREFSINEVKLLLSCYGSVEENLSGVTSVLGDPGNPFLSEESLTMSIRIDHLKNYLQRLSADALDQYEVLHLANTMLFTLRENQTFEQQTCELRCFLLQQLIKQDELNASSYVIEKKKKKVT